MKGVRHASDVDDGAPSVPDVDAASVGSPDRAGAAAEAGTRDAGLRAGDRIHQAHGRRVTPDSLLLTVDEAGAHLRVTGRTIRNMVRAGDIKAVRIGRKGVLRIRRDDLSRYVQRLKTTEQLGAEAWR